MKKRHRNYIILFIIFILGIALGISASRNSVNDKILDFEDIINNPELMPYPITNIDENIFVKISKKGDLLIKKTFEYGIKGISNVFKHIFGL